LPILVPEGTITSDCLRNTSYERLTLSAFFFIVSVSASSVRPPKVTVTFASGLKPSIKIKAFIDGNGNDKFAVEALEAEVTRQVVEHIENPCKVVVDAAFGLVER